MQSEALRAGYALFVAGSNHRPDEEYRLARAIAAQVDGLLLVTPGMPGERFQDLAAITPVAVSTARWTGVRRP